MKAGYSLFINNKQLLLLLLWTAIAFILRFANLNSKPLWTDEFSTLVFSLGNSFRGVPIDRAIDLSTLLQPLQLVPVLALQMSSTICC
jgi:uncharacterized membrane protein